MGFGLAQEIFEETYQRPLIVNKETQAEPKSWLRGRISTGAAWISWERICCRRRSLKSHSCGMPKPITHAKPEWEIFKALDLYMSMTLQNYLVNLRFTPSGAR